MPTGLSLLNGKAVYSTFVTRGNEILDVEVILDINHPQVRKMIDRAARQARHQSVEAGGALVIKARVHYRAGAQ